MRRTIGWTAILVLAAVLAGCGGSAPPTLPGAWELVSPKPEGTVTAGPLIKVLSDGHFAFGRRTEQGDIWAGGGTYAFDGTTYTETVAYHSIASLVGMTIRFSDRLEGDRWHHRATFEVAGETFSIDEVWKRID